MTSTSGADRRMYLILFVTGVAVFGTVAALLPAPGYMDAEYYFATAGQIAQGRGLYEPFIWNFLSAPSSLPVESHTYWQPLASLVAAASMAALGATFRAAQVAMVLLAAAIPPLSARLAVGLGVDRRTAWLAGGLALLPGFFTPFLLTTDTFAVYAVIGGAVLWQVGEVTARPAAGRWLAVGVLIGLGALARADGLLLWIPSLFALGSARARRLRSFTLVLAGFSAVMIPWWLRNLSATGAVISPGAARTLWLLDYDELFSFPAGQLTFSRWWAAGAGTLLLQRLDAAWGNLQSIIAVNGYVLLLPWMAVGGWAHRRLVQVRAGLAYGAALFLFMSFIFPFAGVRGGFFHSSAALMPLLWALAASGLAFAGSWVAGRVGWVENRTRVMFTTISLVLACGLSVWSLAGKAGAFGVEGSFVRNRDTYRAAGEILVLHGDRGSVVAVGDPPGFYLATGAPSVVIPNGDEIVLRHVAEVYGVEWVVLEADHPSGLEALYESPAERTWLAAPLMFLDPSGNPVYLYRVLSAS
jgi:hypothetical protein